MFSITALIRFRCLIKVCTSNNVLSQVWRQQAVFTSDSTSPSCCYELSISVWFSHKALEREKFCEKLALKSPIAASYKWDGERRVLLQEVNCKPTESFPSHLSWQIIGNIRSNWVHQPPTSRSVKRGSALPAGTQTNTHIWGPYRFVLRRHRASFPACLPSVHPLSLHYSTTDPLMVNISDTDAAGKCWQHKSLSAGNWTRRRFALPPHTQRPNKSFQVCVGYFPDVSFDKRRRENSSDLQKFCFC